MMNQVEVKAPDTLGSGPWGNRGPSLTEPEFQRTQSFQITAGVSIGKNEA